MFEQQQKNPKGNKKEINNLMEFTSSRDKKKQIVNKWQAIHL